MGPTKPASAKQPETTLKPAEFAGHGAAVRREEGKGGGGVCVCVCVHVCGGGKARVMWARSKGGAGEDSARPLPKTCSGLARHHVIRRGRPRPRARAM